MSRNFILAMGTVLWTAVAIDVAGHIVFGDWIAPVIAGIVGLTVVAVLRVRRSLPEPA